jgi:hypothetical protein
MPEFVDAYDTRTGAKLRVPAVWIERNLFPHLSLTPRKSGGTKAAPAPKKRKSPAKGADTKENTNA